MRADQDGPGWAVPAGIALCLLSSALAALIEVSLVPLYVGGTIAPVTLLVSAVTNAGLPILVHRLTPASYACFLPVVVWIGCVIGLSTTRPEGDVLLPGGGAQGYVGIGLLLVGAAAGVVTGIVSVNRPGAARTSPGGTGSGSRGDASIRGR